jgi:hypothetical protein
MNDSNYCKLHIQCEQKLLAVRIRKETSTHTPVPEVWHCLYCALLCLFAMKNFPSNDVHTNMFSTIDAAICCNLWLNVANNCWQFSLEETAHLTQIYVYCCVLQWKVNTVFKNKNEVQLNPFY